MRDAGSSRRHGRGRGKPSKVRVSSVKMKTRLSTGTLIMKGTSTVKEKAFQRPSTFTEGANKFQKDAPSTKRRFSSVETLSPMSLKRHRGEGSEGQGKESAHDPYCWICHKEKSTDFCPLCPRSFHLKCLTLSSVPKDWVCNDCEIVMKAECADTRSKAMKQISTDELCLLLRYALERMRVSGSDVFQAPANAADTPFYSDVVINPVNFLSLDKNIKKKEYGSTDAFLADVKWILHNCIIYNGLHHRLTSIARNIVKICKLEMEELEACPQCYKQSCLGDSSWFIEPCNPPHPLVWAKLKGYPFWPAKVLAVSNGQADVRFFGAHDKSWVPLPYVFMMSKSPPTPIRNKKVAYVAAMEEMEKHVSKIKRIFGTFYLASTRSLFDPSAVYHSKASKDVIKDKPRRGRPPKALKEAEKQSAVSKTATALKNKYSSLASKKSTPGFMFRQESGHQANVSSADTTCCSPDNAEKAIRRALDDCGKTSISKSPYINPIVSVTDIQQKLLRKKELQVEERQDLQRRKNNDETMNENVGTKVTLHKSPAKEPAARQIIVTTAMVHEEPSNVSCPVKKTSNSDGRGFATSSASNSKPEQVPIFAVIEKPVKGGERIQKLINLTNKNQPCVSSPTPAENAVGTTKVSDGPSTTSTMKEGVEKNFRRMGDVYVDVETNHKTKEIVLNISGFQFSASHPSIQAAATLTSSCGKVLPQAMPNKNNSLTLPPDKGLPVVQRTLFSGGSTTDKQSDRVNATAFSLHKTPEPSSYVKSLAETCKAVSETQDCNTHSEGTDHLRPEYSGLSSLVKVYSEASENNETSPALLKCESDRGVPVSSLPVTCLDSQTLSAEEPQKIYVPTAGAVSPVPATCASPNLISVPESLAESLSGVVDETSEVQFVGTSQLKPVDNAQVTAVDNSELKPVHNSQVTAVDNSELKLVHNSQVTAVDNSELKLVHNSQVTAVDNSELKPVHNSQVTAVDNSELKPVHNSQVTAVDNSELIPVDNPQVTAVDNLQMKAVNNSQAKPVGSEAKCMERSHAVPASVISDDKPSLMMEVEDGANEDDMEIIDLDDDNNDVNYLGKEAPKSKVPQTSTSHRGFLKKMSPSPAILRRVPVARKEPPQKKTSAVQPDTFVSPSSSSPISPSLSQSLSRASAKACSPEICEISDVWSLSETGHDWKVDGNREAPSDCSEDQNQLPQRQQVQSRSDSESSCVGPLQNTRTTPKSAAEKTQGHSTSPILQYTSTARPSTAPGNLKQSIGLMEQSLSPAAVSMVNKYSQQIVGNMQLQLADMCKELLASLNKERETAQQLQEEKEKLQWQHEQEIAEIQHVNKMKIVEMKACWEAEKAKELSDLQKKLTKEKSDVIAVTKRKQWCAECWKEAMYYCCWNTSYCSYVCQQRHWSTHKYECQQAEEPSADQKTPSTTASSTTTYTSIKIPSQEVAKAPERDSFRSGTVQLPKFNVVSEHGTPIIHIDRVPASAQPLTQSTNQAQPLQFLHAVGGTASATIQGRAQQVQIMTPQPGVNTVLQPGTVMPGNTMVFPILRTTQPEAMATAQSLLLNRPFQIHPVWKNQ